MSNVDRRLDRIEKLLGAPGCTCGDDDAVPILVVQDGWDGPRIKQERDKLAAPCPVHISRERFVLVLKGSEVNG
jgi:hypothetical protein